MKKALLKAKKEYEKGIILEKSGLNGFAKKYEIQGTPGVIPIDFFKEKVSLIKDFLSNNQNTKVKMILVCLMEIKSLLKYDKISYNTSKAYLHSHTHVNLEKTDVKIILKDMIYEILAALANYQKKGSG